MEQNFIRFLRTWKRNSYSRCLVWWHSYLLVSFILYYTIVQGNSFEIFASHVPYNYIIISAISYERRSYDMGHIRCYIWDGPTHWFPILYGPYGRFWFLKGWKPKPSDKLSSPTSIHFQFLFDNFWTFLDIDPNSNLPCHLLLGELFLPNQYLDIFCPLAHNWSVLGNTLLEKWRRREAFEIPSVHVDRSKRRKYSWYNTVMYCHVCDLNRRLSFDIFMFALQMELYCKYSGKFSFKILRIFDQTFYAVWNYWKTGKRHLESDVTPHYKTRDSIHQERKWYAFCCYHYQCKRSITCD